MHKITDTKPKGVGSPGSAQGAVGGISLKRRIRSVPRRIADLLFGYDFFLSYAQKDGHGYPRALADKLEEQQYKVFLDEREYSPGVDLKIGTRRMVRKSRYLLLIARDYLVEREDAAESTWVRQEVETCIQAGRTPIVIDVNGAFSKAAPTNPLKGLLDDRLFIEESIPHPDGHPTEAVIAGLNRGFRATRQDAVRFRWISSAAFLLLVLAMVAAWLAWLAEDRRREADLQRDSAFSRLMVIEGNQARSGQRDLALLLGVAATKIDPSEAAIDLLRNAIMETPRLVRYLHDQGEPWVATGLNEDGSLMVTATKNRRVVVWRISDDRLEPRPLGNCDASISRVALSPDGSWAAAGTTEGRVFVWHTRTSHKGHLLEADHQGPVEGLAFSPDGSKLVSSGAYTRTYLWDTESGQQLAQLDQHKSGVRAIAFAPDGNRLATGAEKGRIVVWDLSKLPGKPAHRLLPQGLSEFVRAIAFSPDGTRLAAGGDDTNVAVWTLLSSSRDPRPLEDRHDGRVLGLRFDRDGKSLAVQTKSGPVSFYNLESRYSHEKAIAADPAVQDGFRYNAEGTGILTAGSDNSVALWNLTVREPMARALKDHEGGARSLAFLPDGNALVAAICLKTADSSMPGCSGNYIRQWDVRDATPKGPPLEMGSRQFRALAMRPDGRSVLVLHRNGDLAVWNLETGRFEDEYPKPEPPPVEKPQVVPDSTARAQAKHFIRVVWTRAVRGELLLAGGSRPRPPCNLFKTGASVYAFSADSESAFIGGNGGCVFKWGMAHGWRVPPIFDAERPLTALAVTPDGSRVAIGDEDGQFAVWDLTGQTVVSWQSLGTNASIKALAFSPAGDLLLVGGGVREPDPEKRFPTASQDAPVGRALLWDIDRDQLVDIIGSTQPVLRGGEVQAVAFTPDGKTAIIGGCRNPIGLGGCEAGEFISWDISKARPTGPPMTAHTGNIVQLAVSPSGNHLATASSFPNLLMGSGDLRILLWDLRPEAWIEKACYVANRGFTEDEAERYLAAIYGDPCGAMVPTAQP